MLHTHSLSAYFLFFFLLLCFYGTVIAHEYLIVGVSGGLQDGFPERSKMDYHPGQDDAVPALFLGKGLVRGYKAFLDVMQPGWRQYIEEPGQPLINSNVFPTGCYEHANEYWIYLIDARQVMAVLNNEPRFLSITPDTGMVDLQADETTPVVRALFTNIIQQQGKSDFETVAIPLVTAVWFQKESHVPSPPIRIHDDGTQITNFPESLALWANVSDADRTALVQEDCSDQTCSAEALQRVQRYWDGIRRAVRHAEQSLAELKEVDYGPPFSCQKKVRFGVGNDTARINDPFSSEQMTALLQSVGFHLEQNS
jgi:hypothetical protein